EVPLYQRMPEALRAELRGLVNVFLAEKAFIGCEGLVVTDEMRVVIAGNACALLVGGHAEFFDGFRNILIYPETYVVPHVHHDGDVVTEGYVANAGESWHAGPVVLAWSDIRKGMEHPEDGNNVVIHEFAHKLDEQNDAVDGLPVLRDKTHYDSWARVLTREFADLVERVETRSNTVLDSYGATSPPEFFAVATETFFERGRLMQEKLPELYEELRKFYDVDPASWAVPEQ
ncbi:MAG: zinc-dependent peptidase, partial [Gammaproteobacteria bacterium]|nr:zinc-dependent peptidase [Gammaproteobacteria bacterium]